MHELTGLFRCQQSARVAVDALREAGFSTAIINGPNSTIGLGKEQLVADGNPGQIAAGDKELLYPVHLNVVLPYAATVERILKKKGALTICRQASEPFA